jgi:diguanylate cyclase (GGDEF)-like protein
MERAIGILTHLPLAQELSPHARDQAALDSALRLARTGYPKRAFKQALPVLEQARARADMCQVALAAQILSGTCLMMGKYEPGIEYGREARLLFGRLGDLARKARSGANLAWLLASIGEEDALAEALEALDTAERSGDPTETILALDVNAIVLWLLRQCDQALPFAERAVELSRMHRPRLQRPLINLAGLRVALAREAGTSGAALAPVIADAISLTQEALVFSRAVGDGWLERLALCNIAEYRLHLADAAGAERALEQYSATAGEMSDRCTCHYLHMLGRVRRAQGRPQEAIDVLTECSNISCSAVDLETAAPCLQDLSDLYADIGDFETALKYHRAFHDLYVRQASHAAQRRARLSTLEREAERLRATVDAARKQAAELSASNRDLARETERLLRASMEDPLTGLQNRRRMDLAYPDLAASGRQYAVAMIDVDRFKEVNDSFTHPVGDAVLREVAGKLRDHARAGDLTVRFGGDEFAMLFYDADLSQAAAICERLLQCVASYHWSRLHPGLAVTLSIGVASADEADSGDGVLALADTRLYCAKRFGRNRVQASGVSRQESGIRLVAND